MREEVYNCIYIYVLQYVICEIFTSIPIFSPNSNYILLIMIFTNYINKTLHQISFPSNKFWLSTELALQMLLNAVKVKLNM